MELNQKTISEFQALYKKKTGIDLSDIDAETKALQLLTFTKLVYRPLKKGEIEDEEKNKNIQKRDQKAI